MNLTIVILCSPSPKHPSIQMITETLDSLNFLGLNKELPIIISHDFPHPESPGETFISYEQYLRNLKVFVSGKSNISIIESTSFSHLSGSISNSLKYVDSKYVLFVQHDLKFIAPVDLNGCILAMEENSRIKHVRFNKNVNQAKVWDQDPAHRKLLFREIRIEQFGTELKLIRTLGWSDNNHLTRTEYYRSIVMPMVGMRRTFPENILNITSGIFTNAFLGTYIYGGLGLPAVIEHLDGRDSSNRILEEKSLMKRMHSNNKERVKIGILRIYYKMKFWIVLVISSKKRRNSKTIKRDLHEKRS